MTESELMRETQAAVERMREMNARSKINDNIRHKMPPSPSFVKVNGNTIQQNFNSKQQNTEVPQKEQREVPKHQMNSTSQSNNLSIPFLDSILKDGDSTLIIGLLLILMSENTDKILLFALVYILL